MDDFKANARAALTLAGVEVAPADLEVLEMVVQAFAPGILALDSIDLAQLPAEGDLDPGRPPRLTRLAQAGA